MTSIIELHNRRVQYENQTFCRERRGRSIDNDYPHPKNDKQQGLFRRSDQTLENQLQPSHILERAGWTHFYVVEENDTIIGCGAIGPYWGSETESSLFTIFVLPEYQGKGVGRKIIEALEQDEYFLKAKRVEIPASITAVNFYRKMGYEYKNVIDHPGEEQLYRLEKFR